MSGKKDSFNACLTRAMELANQHDEKAIVKWLEMVNRCYTDVVEMRKAEKKRHEEDALKLRVALDRITHLSVSQDMKGNSERLAKAVALAEEALGPLPTRKKGAYKRKNK